MLHEMLDIFTPFSQIFIKNVVLFCRTGFLRKKTYQIMSSSTISLSYLNVYVYACIKKHRRKQKIAYNFFCCQDTKIQYYKTDCRWLFFGMENHSVL